MGDGCRWLGLIIATLVIAGCANPVQPPSARDTEPSATPTPETIAISTSGWEPGDFGHRALIRGVLRFDDDGCPYLESAGGARWVVWPAGFSARFGRDGEPVLLTASGKQIREGDSIESAGANSWLPAEKGTPCIATGKTLTLIESEVEIVQRP